MNDQPTTPSPDADAYSDPEDDVTPVRGTRFPITLSEPSRQDSAAKPSGSGAKSSGPGAKPDAAAQQGGAAPSGALASSGAQAGTAATAGTAAPALESPQPRTREQLRAVLGLPSRLPSRVVTRNGWIATVVTTLIAAFTRLWNLGSPHEIMFDETYYVKDAYSIWHLGYEGTWAQNANASFVRGNFSMLSPEASFVVHPPLGKWLIAMGMEAVGPASSWGWRLAVALAGIATVLLLCRLVWRLFPSPLLVGLAGLFLAIDGVGITESRIGLLDGFIGFFALAAVYCIVRDRQSQRERIARLLEGTAAGALAPKAGWRPWMISAGVLLGCACSVKWSGLYLLATIGIMTVIWDGTALRAVKAKVWKLETLVSRGWGNFMRLVPVAGVTYLLTWFGWFMNPSAYKHGWAAAERAAGRGSWLPDSIADFIEYHRAIYEFHVGLSTPHSYMAKPSGWLLQMRPTSFYWWQSDKALGTNTYQCDTHNCVRAITSIGNIPIWWAAFVAVFVVVAYVALKRDWRGWVVLAGYIGLYLPWFMYWDRTIFTFYTVAFVPFVVLALTVALGWGIGLLDGDGVVTAGSGGSAGSGSAGATGSAGAAGADTAGTDASDGSASDDVAAKETNAQGDLKDKLGAYLGGGQVLGKDYEPSMFMGLILTGIIVLAAVVFAFLWWPIWTAQVVDYDFWLWHMLFRSWI
ncbi:MAG: phospholipid carrier-dependent glycosyltransferase [Actinomyces graevenitzii]|nr:phospholipid carrier-dependent glycosyltransferase [Actinomyces graevenitzii]